MTVTEEPTRTTPARRTSWWRRPWMAPLGFVVLVFLVYSLPPYLGLDPEKSRIPVPPGMDWYYPVLVTHIGFATIAMVTCALQIWPWLRQRNPVLHRRIGRMYVFGGAIPASIAGFGIAQAGFLGPVAETSDITLAVLWFTTTILGFRAARARRFADHRRWMIRSFVLCMSIISNRIWNVVWALVLTPHLNDMFGGSEQVFGQSLAGLTTWTGWVFPLLLSQLWLDRSRRRPSWPAVTAR